MIHELNTIYKGIITNAEKAGHFSGKVALKALSPVFGALPESWQNEIEKRYDYNKRLATQISGLAEVWGGFFVAAYVVHMDSLLVGDVIIMLTWLDGMYRYTKSHGHGKDYKICGIFPTDAKEIYNDIICAVINEKSEK